MKLKRIWVLGLTLILNLIFGNLLKANELILDSPPGIIKIECYDENIIRVIYSLTDSFPETNSLVVIAKPKTEVKSELKGNEKEIMLKTTKLQLKISLKTGAISFYNQEGELLLKEPDSGGKTLTKSKVQGENTYHSQQIFQLAQDEAIYGLGQYQDGIMNWRGQKVLMAQANTIAVVPFLVSTKGYGILWDNYSLSKFIDKKDGARFWSEVADAIDYYFIYGPELDQVIAGYRKLTGSAPMFPKWAYGYFQSKERYKTQEEILSVVKEYRRRGLPLDVIVQDWMYWGKLGWNAMQFDQSIYPDPKGMMEELHNKYNVHLMISVWPKFGPETEIYRLMKQKGFLYPYHGLGEAGIYDAFNPEARKLYWDYLNQGIFSQGVDAWWLDATEPEFGVSSFRFLTANDFKKAGASALGPTSKYLNAYSLLTTEGVYQGQRSVTNDQRVFILTRSAFAGQQRNAAATWSGDIKGTWHIFKKQIPAGLNFSLAGIPYWTTDIGGFFTDTSLFIRRINRNEDPEYQELYLRWFQYGAFCPIFRSHGTNTPREIWQFGEKGSLIYETLAKYDQLRYRLLPYIYSLAWKVTSQGYTIMRGLPMDFRADSQVRKITDQFMFGPAILVNPVTEPKAISRKVYLPLSPGWYDFWTGKKFASGQTIETPAPMEIMPLFVKAGSLLPMGPFLQYAMEKPADPIELRIYLGADGELMLYEDDGLTYNYEKGEYAIIPISWSEADKTLTLGERKGSFPGMLKTRTFRVVWVAENHGVGIEDTKNPDLTVSYSGKEIKIKK